MCTHVAHAEFLEEYLGHSIAIAVLVIDTPNIGRGDLLLAEYHIHGSDRSNRQYAGKIVGIGHADDACSIALLRAQRWIDAQCAALN